MSDIMSGNAIIVGISRRWETKNVLGHDGSKLSGISMAARFGSKVVLGSPWSEGILVCDLN